MTWDIDIEIISRIIRSFFIQKMKMKMKEDKAPFLCEVEGCVNPHIPFQRYCHEHLQRSLEVLDFLRRISKNDKKEERA